MKLLITGICGFVGQTLAKTLLEHLPGLELVGIDNLIRPGSELNRRKLEALGVKFIHTDLRSAADLGALPPVEWVIDAAANASVLAGLANPAASRQLVEHNLTGTLNLLEYCRVHNAGLVLLSTSRVYSIEPLARLKLRVESNAFQPDPDQDWPRGCSPDGISEDFPQHPPLSLYGTTKLASELLALEYGAAFRLPIWINRCGVMAGAGQFGRADQGIFTYWLASWAIRRHLTYTGFDGKGHQVRDCLHPADLTPILLRQMREAPLTPEPPCNFGGGSTNSMSMVQLSQWCAGRFGENPVASDPSPRPFDLPWLVLDCRRAEKRWGWKPTTRLPAILEEIAQYIEKHPGWLDTTSA